MITLLLESNLQDRTELADSLMRAFVASVYTADTAEQAESYAMALDGLDLLIADVAPGQEEKILALRNTLREKHPGLFVALVSGGNLDPYLDQLAKEEAAFSKPIKQDRLFEWLGKVFPGDLKASAPDSGDSSGESGPGLPPVDSEHVPAVESSSSPPPQPPAAPSEPQPAPPQPPAAPTEPASPPSEPPPATTEMPQSAPAASPDAGVPPLTEGTELGDYELLEFVSRGGSSDRFIALQKSIDRKVRLRMLRPDYQGMEKVRERFRAEAQAQAAVRNSQIATVFESHETDSALYYTQELIQEDTFEALAAQKKTLTEEEALSAIKSAAQAFQFLHKNDHDFLPIWPEHLHRMSDGTVKIANTVILADPEDRVSQRDQLKNLAKCVHPLLDKDTIANETLPTLLYEMAGTVDENSGHVLETWSDLLDEVKYIEQQWKEMGGGITARRAGIYFGIVIASVAALVLITVLGVKFFQILTRSGASVGDNLIRIPAGKFIYQDGEETELGEFWISAHEVTVAQYAEFLEHVAENPDQAASFDHPNQPGYKKHHRPVGWETYYKAARENGKWRYQEGNRSHVIKVDLDCPITLIDWWDAYAYAKWKGRRLPTELEWEKAARGRQGNIYPWGNELDYTKLNSGIDHIEPADPDSSSEPSKPEPKGKGAEPTPGDGFNYWNPVNAMEGDSSHYLVKGMAGNVSEWTSDWVPHPTQAGKEVPVMRGASYVTRDQSELPLTVRRLAGDHTNKTLWAGFRTASDYAPGSEPVPSATPTDPASAPTPNTETPPAEPEEADPFADGFGELGN